MSWMRGGDRLEVTSAVHQDAVRAARRWRVAAIAASAVLPIGAAAAGCASDGDRVATGSADATDVLGNPLPKVEVKAADEVEAGFVLPDHDYLVISPTTAAEVATWGISAEEAVDIVYRTQVSTDPESPWNDISWASTPEVFPALFTIPGQGKIIDWETMETDPATGTIDRPVWVFRSSGHLGVGDLNRLLLEAEGTTVDLQGSQQAKALAGVDPRELNGPDALERRKQFLPEMIRAALTWRFATIDAHTGNIILEN